MKKNYQKPAMRIVTVQHHQHLLAGSLQSVESIQSNLDDESDVMFDWGGGSNTGAR